MQDRFLSSLKSLNWQVVPTVLPVKPHERLIFLPADLRALLTAFDLIANKEDTQWLVTAHVFASNATEGFKWNEFECLSLAAAQGDQAWSKEVSKFWRKHIPVFMSVKGRYEYVAYCCEGRNRGGYMLGQEPEFEEVEKVAASIEEFLEWVISNASDSSA